MAAARRRDEMGKALDQIWSGHQTPAMSWTCADSIIRETMCSKQGGVEISGTQCPRIKEQRELYKEKKKEEAKEEIEEISCALQEG
jgi:hypothetical protein